MRINKKLNEWQQAGLIDDQLRASIERYESASSRPVALWAAGGLGAFAIAVGLISVVASNWLLIPDSVKIGTAVSLCAALALAIYRAVSHSGLSKETVGVVQSFWLQETLIILFYGLVLASMALVGQTYQLDGSAAGLLLLWTAVTLPVVLLARGRFMAMLWVVATGLTYLLNAEPLYEFSLDTLGFAECNAEAAAICWMLLGPLIFLWLSRLPWLQAHRLVYAKVVSDCSWLLIIAGGFFTQFLWYAGNVAGEIPAVVFFVLGFATLLTAVFVPKLYQDSSADTHLAMRVVLISVYLFGFVACWHESSLELVGALSNLLYLCLLGWAALKIRSTPLFNLVTAIIALRVLFIYFEVFGSMLETGLGLIIGGALTLGLTWLWLKKSNSMAKRLEGAGGE